MHHKNNFRGGQGKRNIHDYNDYNKIQSLRVYPDKGSCVTGSFISKHLRSCLRQRGHGKTIDLISKTIAQHARLKILYIL